MRASPGRTATLLEGEPVRDALAASPAPQSAVDRSKSGEAAARNPAAMAAAARAAAAGKGSLMAENDIAGRDESVWEGRSWLTYGGAPFDMAAQRDEEGRIFVSTSPIDRSERAGALRFPHETTFYYDLDSDTWTADEIDSDGWVDLEPGKVSEQVAALGLDAKLAKFLANVGLEVPGTLARRASVPLGDGGTNRLSAAERTARTAQGDARRRGRRP